MTTAILIQNKFYTSKRLDKQFELLQQAFKKYSLHLQLKCNTDLCVPLGQEIFDTAPQFVLMWDKDVLLAKQLEMQGIKVFNSSDAIAICDDKSLTHLALDSAKIPTPKTVLCPLTYDNVGFKNTDFLNNIVTSLGFPMIVKQCKSSYGMGVYKADNLEQLKSIISNLNCPIIFQQCIMSSLGKDVRVNVVGDKVINAVQRHNLIDFRSNVLQGGSMSCLDISPRIQSLALVAKAACGCDFCGVDLLIDEDDYLVCEINSSAHFATALDQTGINMADKIAQYICEEKGYAL